MLLCVIWQMLRDVSEVLAVSIIMAVQQSVLPHEFTVNRLQLLKILELLSLSRIRAALTLPYQIADREIANKNSLLKLNGISLKC
jgi:hypothetical protein